MIEALLQAWHAAYQNDPHLQDFFTQYAGTVLAYEGLSQTGMLLITRSGLVLCTHRHPSLMTLDTMGLIRLLSGTPPYPQDIEGASLVADFVRAVEHAKWDRFSFLCDYLGPVGAIAVDEGLNVATDTWHLLESAFGYELQSMLYPYLTHPQYEAYQEELRSLDARISILERQAHD